jgi:hypothetical protein
VEFIAAISTN